MPPFHFSKRSPDKDRSKQSKSKGLKTIFSLPKLRQTSGKATDENKQSRTQVEDEATVYQPVNPFPSLELRFEQDQVTFRSYFSGAPQFSITISDNRHLPTVTFPWDDEGNVRDLRDCLPFSHWSMRSAAAKCAQDPEDASDAIPEYSIGVMEVPNMCGFQGHELGTVGFEYFLQDFVSDIKADLQKERDQDSIGSATDNIKYLDSNMAELGLQVFNMDSISKGLVELSTVYKDFKKTGGKIHLLKGRTTEELYDKLFKDLLVSKYVSSQTDPKGLLVQIESLVQVLKLSGIWYDFSTVELRVGIGKVLFSRPSEMDDEPALLTAREIMLLQIALSCELLMRLEAINCIAMAENLEDHNLSVAKMTHFHSLETKKTRWDLITARTILQNMEIQMASRLNTPAKDQTESSSRTLPLPQPSSHVKVKSTSNIEFHPRHLTRQLDGLIHFGKVMSWPNMQELEEALDVKLDSPAASVYLTPPSSPIPRSRRSSYLSLDIPRPISRRSTPTQLVLNQGGTGELSAGRPKPMGGWPTRSYLTGLVLPGESICHFLMFALLENDRRAFARVGDTALVYGGIVYNWCSWWSKFCIVGRVMAAMSGARECMGWIYVPLKPAGCRDGWYEVRDEEVEPIDGPRLTRDWAVDLDAHVFSNADIDHLEEDDFTYPSEWDDESPVGVRFDSFRLRPCGRESLETNQTTVTSSNQPKLESVAELLFYTSAKGDETEHCIPLTHHVQFVSAHACRPPMMQMRTWSGTMRTSSESHPLHVRQPHVMVRASDLLLGMSVDLSEAESPSRPTVPGVDMPFERLNLGGTDWPISVGNSEQMMLVVDAHTEDMALLARAWCSWKGEHAVVGRVNVTCIACCVREARGLGMRVVIRVGRH